MSACPARAVPDPSQLDVKAAYAEHGAFLGRVIRRLIGDGPDVDDVLQDTFVIAHRKFDAFEGRSELRTWLYAIAANLCMSHNRGRRRRGAFRDRLAKEPCAHPEGPEKALERQELRVLICEALSRLPFAQREAYTLYELEELSGQEIAELVGVPLATVWTRLRKARKKMEATIERQLKREAGR